MFCKSWSLSADGKLLAAAILIFIPGILKCLAKPWGLKCASFRNLADSLDVAERTISANREEELQNYVRKARTCFLNKENPPLYMVKLYVLEMLFVDFPYTYSRRLINLRSFCALKDKQACRSLQDGLSDVFDLLYTKTNTSLDNNIVGILIWMLSMFLPMAATVLFHISHKNAYRSDDVGVTFVLLYSTIVLECNSVGVMSMFEDEWPDTVAQRSVLGQFAHNKRHGKLMSLATCLGCKDLLDQYWSSVEACHSSWNMTILVRRHVEDGWKDYITDGESYREFNDIRGQWTLEKWGCHGRLSWSLEKPFDESVLLWHIATDLCFHLMGTYPSHPLCREMSNYMMHLLIANPEMLMPGSRRSLVPITYNELETIFMGEEDMLIEEDKVAKQVFDKVKATKLIRTRESFIYNACVLAERLMDLGGEKMWKVIQGVWLEMMCFSAGRCRGYLHAKALASGGEYLSYVWLVLAHYGMETFPERLQRTQKLHISAENIKHHRSGSQNVAGPSASWGREGEITAPAPSSSQGTEQKITATLSASEGTKEEITTFPSTSRGPEEETTTTPSTSQGDCAVDIVVSP